MTQHDETHLRPRDLCERWGWAVTTRTLREWRRAGKGPRYIRPSYRVVLYPLSGIREYERANEIVPEGAGDG